MNKIRFTEENIAYFKELSEIGDLVERGFNPLALELDKQEKGNATLDGLKQANDYAYSQTKIAYGKMESLKAPKEFESEHALMVGALHNFILGIERSEGLVNEKERKIDHSGIEAHEKLMISTRTELTNVMKSMEDRLDWPEEN